jgi:hypothetical protein
MELVMKNLFLTVVVLLSMLAITDSYAQSSCCPPGYTNATVTEYIYDISGSDSCEVTVNFCHFLSPSGTRHIKICSVTILSNCILDVNLSDGSFWDQIFGIAIDYSDSQLAFPPCNSSNPTALVVEITRASCWILMADWQNQQYVFEPCEGDAYCYNFYEVCWEAGILTKTPYSSHGSGSVDCTYEHEEGYLIHPDTFPFDECFDTCY